MAELTIINPDNPDDKKTFYVEKSVCGTAECTGKKSNSDYCQDGKCKCPPEHSTEKRIFEAGKPDPANMTCQTLVNTLDEEEKKNEQKRIDPC